MCDDEVPGNGLIASGGWCAPYPALSEEALTGHYIDDRIALPEISVARGGITFPRPPKPGTPEYARAEADRREREAFTAFVHRHVGNIREAQDSAMDSAIFTALFEGWEVHFQRSYNSRFVGVAYRDRGPGHLVTYHEDGWWWENLEDDDE